MLDRTDQDVAFWRAAAAEAGGPVLELACGTGRLTFPLARAGIAVIGVDNDPAMLRTAERRREGPSGRIPQPGPWPLFVAADMRDFAFAARFALVFVGYNSLQLLRQKGEMAACLGRARQHLAGGGLVGVEVTDFQAGGADGPDPATDEGDWVLLGEADGIHLSGTLTHDLGARTSRYRRRFVGPGWTVDDEVVLRSLNRTELGEVISDAGLVAVRWWETGPTIGALAAPLT